MPLLQGLKVVDASQFNAGPIVSLYLAGYGAEVIKVERPGGEDSRAIGPFKNGESSYFMSLNRGKRSITLDLKNPEGVEVFRKLCRGADVLVENLLPGVMDRLGVGWDVLKAENPRLIYAAVSGFGQTGKNARRPAFDSLLQAAGGLISVTGPVDGEPVRVGVSIVDVASGLYLLSGVLTALFRRERTGEGMRVDASMMGATGQHHGKSGGAPHVHGRGSRARGAFPSGGLSLFGLQDEGRPHFRGDFEHEPLPRIRRSP